jgi:hypothetical protein
MRPSARRSPIREPAVTTAKSYDQGKFRFVRKAGALVFRAGGSVLAGICVTMLAWRVAVPWDLSLMAEDGRPIVGAMGDGEKSARIFGIFLGLTALAVVMALSGRPRWLNPTLFFLAGGTVWGAVYTWRSLEARIPGANFGFALAALFAVFAVPSMSVAIAVADRLARRRMRA